MALVSLNLKPTIKQLKSFALVGLIMCLVVGGALFGLGKLSALGLILFIASGILLYTLSRLRVAWVKPIYLVLILLTFPFGWIFSHAVMAVFYYGIITPVALFFRLIKRDVLCRKYDSSAPTYWIRYTHKRSAKDYFRQF